MGWGSAPAREISFVSLMAYGPKVSDSALAIGVTASETRQAVPNTLPLMFLSIAHPPLQAPLQLAGIHRAAVASI